MSDRSATCNVPEASVREILQLVEQIQRPMVIYRSPDARAGSALDMANEALKICQDAAGQIDDILARWAE